MRKYPFLNLLYFRLVNAKNVTDLVKSYGPTDESLLMTLCCQKNDSPSLRAQIFAFISRVLEESNDEAIEMIIKKNSAGLSALDYATMANNAKIAAFLAEIFYIFGQDLLCKDNQVSFEIAANRNFTNCDRNLIFSRGWSISKFSVRFRFVKKL